MVYLDNSATTYPKPECVYSQLDNLQRNFSFNAGRGTYFGAEEAARLIEESRAAIAKIADTQPEKVIFTPTATDALNQIIFGLNLVPGDCVLVSPFEHNAIMRPLSAIDGIEIEVIPFNPDTWDLEEKELNKLLRLKRPKAVFISEVSNVTGYRLPMEKIFDACAQFGTVNVLDSSQAFSPGNSYQSLKAFIVFNGHKSLYGAMGAAGYINKSGYVLKQTKYGGTGSNGLSLFMPETIPPKYEPGSLNVPSIGILTTSIKWLKTINKSSKERLVSKLIIGLKNIQGVTVYLPDNVESEGIVSFNLEGYSASDVAEILWNDFKIAVRGGYHCAPLIHKFIGSENRGGTVRVSVGFLNSESDIDDLLEAVTELSEEIYGF